MTSMTDFHSKRITMSYRATPTRPGWAVLFSIIAATVVAAMIGSVASLNAPEFYQALAKPWWAPPAWVFGPVWGPVWRALESTGTSSSTAVSAGSWSMRLLNGLGPPGDPEGPKLS